MTTTAKKLSSEALRQFLNSKAETQIHTSLSKDQTLSTTYFLTFCITSRGLVNKNYSGFDEFIPDSVILKKQTTSNLGCLNLLVI